MLMRRHGCPVKDSVERCNAVKREDLRGNPACRTPAILLQILSLTVFERMPISSLLERFGDSGALDLPNHQLRLFELCRIRVILPMRRQGLLWRKRDA